VLPELLQKCRRVATVLDRGHEVLDFAVEFFLAFSHLLNFSAQASQGGVQLPTEFAYRILDHFRPKKFRLNASK
jgi:hypothetical protein